MILAISIAALAVLMVTAIRDTRPLIAVPVALASTGLLLAVGAVHWDEITGATTTLADTLLFLAAILIVGQLAAADGVFRYLGWMLGQLRGGGPGRLLAMVFVIAAVVTAVLNLDATIVLLTPVVLHRTVRHPDGGVPYSLACLHLANTASLLLPVSNLTNLVALQVAPIGFGHFAALMALPWLAAIAVEFGVFRWVFARPLRVGAQASSTTEHGAKDEQNREPRRPIFTLLTLAVMLVGFGVLSLLDIPPVWPAAGAVLVLLAHRRLVARHPRPIPAGTWAAANLPFLVTVLAMAVAATAIGDAGLSDALTAIVPSGSSLPELLAIAGISAVAAMAVNNIPATLLLVPVVAAAGPLPLLAMLIGTNIGPNMTPTGSLATMLWSRILAEHERPVRWGTFHKVGLLTTPIAVAVAVVALWWVGQWLGPILL